MRNFFCCGEAGSGKSSVVNYFNKLHGYKMGRFAYPLYDICRNYLNMTEKDRILLQRVGTDVARWNIDDDIWVNRLLEDMEIVTLYHKNFLNSDVGFVVEDVRFPKEAKILLKRGFLGFYLDVPSETRSNRLMSRDGGIPEGFEKHESETAILGFRDTLMWINGVGTIEEVSNLIEKFVINED